VLSRYRINQFALTFEADTFFRSFVSAAATSFFDQESK
jgi:hypothetical protein